MSTPSTPPATPPDQPELNWEKHLRWLLPLSAAIVVLTAGLLWRQSRNTRLRTEVWQAYNAAVDADALVAFSQAYPQQPEAALALLQAAALRYNRGEYEEARLHYASFLQDHPLHPLAENAEWGLWMSVEALGDLDAALRGFQSVSTEHLLYPQALLGQARVLEKQQQIDGALAVYDRLVEELGDTPWAEQARVFARDLRMRTREVATPPPAAAE